MHIICSEHGIGSLLDRPGRIVLTFPASTDHRPVIRFGMVIIYTSMYCSTTTHLLLNRLLLLLFFLLVWKQQVNIAYA